jgi:hypothetical protein
VPKASEQPTTGPLLLILIVGAVLWFANRGGDGPTPVPPGPEPVVTDPLQQAYDADRVSQVAVLRELAQQPFDGATDDGRIKAGEWFNKQRFRNRPDDYGAYTDAVAEAIAGNAENELADRLEAAQ